MLSLRSNNIVGDVASGHPIACRWHGWPTRNQSSAARSLSALRLCFLLRLQTYSLSSHLHSSSPRRVVCGMKTRSQTAPKPLKTVRLPPKASPSPKPRKKGPLDDPRRPKKPPTAFFYFMEDFRKTFREENPSVKSMQEIGKACGEKWNTMTFEEKVKYYDLATERRAEFEKAMAEYNKKKESGELSEESDYD